MQKEKYEDMIETKNGKRVWSKDAEKKFAKNLDEAICLVNEKPARILLFSRQFMGANPKVVEAAINTLFETLNNMTITPCFLTLSYLGVNYILEYLPYEVLREHYRLIFQYVEKNGNLLIVVPHRLQEEYLQIPMEAVRNSPHVKGFVSKKAAESYPDIVKTASKMKTFWRRDCFLMLHANGEKLTKDEENVFANNLHEAICLVRENPARILLFSRQFMGANPKVVEEAIKTMLEIARDNLDKPCFWGVRRILKEMPYEILREHYRLVFEYVQKNGYLLICIPFKLQEEYLQIPMEAVRNVPLVRIYVSDKAIKSYPDIEKLSDKLIADWTMKCPLLSGAF